VLDLFLQDEARLLPRLAVVEECAPFVVFSAAARLALFPLFKGAVPLVELAPLHAGELPCLVQFGLCHGAKLAVVIHARLCNVANLKLPALRDCGLPCLAHAAERKPGFDALALLEHDLEPVVFADAQDLVDRRLTPVVLARVGIDWWRHWNRPGIRPGLVLRFGLKRARIFCSRQMRAPLARKKFSAFIHHRHRDVIESTSWLRGGREGSEATQGGRTWQ